LLSIFSACTIGGEESQGVVTIESTTETTIVDEETTFEEGVLDFAQCMREEGINFPDPTFDIDGIDPTFAPGTGTPEVGGFNVREAQTIIRALNKINFVGGDVVEVSPPFDVNNMTSLVGATIAFEMLCTMTKVN